MAEKGKHLYCPLSMAGLLDSKLRRLLFNPTKILKPYIARNMTALDFGCGPGVYTIEIARLLEGTGKVIAVDMQEAMLEIVKGKIAGTALEKNIALRQCSQESAGLTEKVDFALLFYVVHEVPSAENLFNELLPLLHSGGLLMIVEPKLVSARTFGAMVDSVKRRGFKEHAVLNVFFSRGVVLQKQ